MMDGWMDFGIKPRISGTYFHHKNFNKYFNMIKNNLTDEDHYNRPLLETLIYNIWPLSQVKFISSKHFSNT